MAEAAAYEGTDRDPRPGDIPDDDRRPSGPRCASILTGGRECADELALILLRWCELRSAAFDMLTRAGGELANPTGERPTIPAISSKESLNTSCSRNEVR